MPVLEGTRLGHQAKRKRQFGAIKIVLHEPSREILNGLGACKHIIKMA
jgi:hypothetical protein